MASQPNFFGVLARPRNDLLADIGGALGLVKRRRGLTAEDMRIIFGLKVDDMVARYIAGEAEMGVASWMRALEAWPELAELLEETTAERAMQGRQRALDLDICKRDKAA